MAGRSKRPGRRIPRALAAAVGLALLPACSMTGAFYRPSRTLAPAPSSPAVELEVVRFRSGNDSLLHGWMLSPRAGAPRAAVLHLHGNIENLSHHVRYVLPLVEAGFLVLTFDYQGYGLSEGEVSHENVLEDSLAALRLLAGSRQARGLPLVVFGQSLGGHLAPVVAARGGVKIDAVVLEGAFTSHPEIAQATSAAPGLLVRLFVRSPYSGLARIAELSAPLLVVHGLDDQVVPAWMGERLFATARAPKQLWLVEGPHLGVSVRHTAQLVRRLEALLERR